MYVGLWYYILIPISAWIIVTPLQPNSSFFSGMGVALALTYMPFLISNWISDIPDGKGEVIFLKGFGSIVVGFLLAIIVSVVIS
ncbi:hypothetical protein [Psychromonas sp. SA13A]|uniref:hypothetical protein n=1 Tax=Psychromonas sp. SA13A TaxID=2686346 RepID=UPI00140B6848|nr:hypothetical protein [Psychromonas sp. SA13A]